MDLHEELERLVDALAEGGQEYALCGGMALAVHGHPRFTEDIGLLVRREDLEAVLAIARGLGYGIDAGEIPFGVGGAHAREVRRVSRVEGVEMLSLDLLILPPFLEDVWQSREVFEWAGRQLYVVSREGLSKMKRLAGRSQDLADLERLDGEADG